MSDVQTVWATVIDGRWYAVVEAMRPQTHGTLIVTDLESPGNPPVYTVDVTVTWTDSPSESDAALWQRLVKAAVDGDGR